MVRNDNNLSKYTLNDKYSEHNQNESSGCKRDEKDTLPNSVRFSNDDKFWNDFKIYLINEKHSQSSIRDKISYARRFYHVLEKNDASSLSLLTTDVKSHAMKALAALSKFIGMYDSWLTLIKKYNLKWSNGSGSLATFKTIFEDNGKDLKSMIDWIKKVSAILPDEYKNILLFNTLTGLRPDEAQKSIWLIKTKEKEYIDKERGILKHYQFPSIFLRQTKNAYVSVFNDQILEIAKRTPKRESYYNSLRKKIAIKNGYDMNMYYCRKVFATYFRNKGIEPEIIDLLQGRISSSVFVNHYYRPDINEIITKRIRPVLDELRNDLIQ
ncbi:hypothetical protein NMY3_03022 [Candidatus Nitrosocosmicus oleophilus]|uniref:Integrase SSV1 C-terminal domain-containing protein n=2 Tax=Candidatus Nitrosocosmicus oleophilus TaxID=1353260 RepID=A0A654M424_9ARCH|nr:hypothetical protein NMY3_03022 [Candidatus Nitrosocosmicus oleophilus]